MMPGDARPVLKEPSISAIFVSVLLRDIRLAWRAGGAGPLTIGFFLMAVSLFPFAIGSDSAQLARVAAGLVWVSGFFAALLSLDRLFQVDFEDGTLVQLMLSPLSPSLMVLAKALAHWIATLLPLVLFAPLAGIMLQLEGPDIMLLSLGLLIGTPALSLIGALAASLTVLIKRGGVIITLLVLPLFLPTVIFGAGSVEIARVGLDPSGALALLGATSLIALVLVPGFAALALKASLD